MAWHATQNLKGNHALLTLVKCLQDIRPKVGGPPVGPKLIKRGDVAKSSYDGSLPTFKNPCCAGH